MVSNFSKTIFAVACASILFAVPVQAAVSDGPAFETETIAMSTPEFICISHYHHFIDKDGMLCIQNNGDDRVFAKETTAPDTGIFVYYLDGGELRPMCHDDGTQIRVNME